MSNLMDSFQNLKKEIEDLKVKKISDQREKSRLEEELDEIKDQVKREFGVNIEDLDSEIKALEKKLEEELEDVKKKIADCKEKMKE